jgi:hypothetical protein
MEDFLGRCLRDFRAALSVGLLLPHPRSNDNHHMAVADCGCADALYDGNYGRQGFAKHDQEFKGFLKAEALI